MLKQKNKFDPVRSIVALSLLNGDGRLDNSTAKTLIAFIEASRLFKYEVKYENSIAIYFGNYEISFICEIKNCLFMFEDLL